MTQQSKTTTNKDPAVLLYTSDFLTGTLFMNYEEKGKYITLLCIQHQKGRLTKEELFSICSKEDVKVISKFSIAKNGLYFNKRLEDESIKRKKYSESRRNNRLNKNKDKEDINNICKTYDKHMEDEIVSKDNIVFEDFYLQYPIKKSKVQALRNWNRLSETIKSKCIDVVNSKEFKDWVEKQDNKYIKHPSTWLSQGCWEDELEIKPKSSLDDDELFKKALESSK